MEEKEKKLDADQELAAIGMLLREARLQKGVTLEAVQEETKIRRRYLEALEAGERTAFPGEVYLKGFLKSYARFLGLPGDELVARYASALAPGSEDKERTRLPTVPAGRFLPRGTVLAATLLAVLLVAGVSVLVRSPAPREPAPKEQPPVTVPAPAAPAPAAPSSPELATELTAPKVQLVVDQPREAVYQVSGAEILLEVTVVGERCWVAVRRDDGPEEVATLTRGERRSYRAGDKVWLRAGDPGALVVTVNGVALGPAGQAGRPRNLTFRRAE